MKDFKAEWKRMLSVDKERSSVDMFQYQIFKALTAKTPVSYEVRVALASIFLRRAFTPITNENKLGNGNRPFSALRSAQWASRIQPEMKVYNDLRDCLETEEDKALYSKLCDEATKKLYHKLEEMYAFFFVRRDLPIEQVIVQSSHAAFVLGSSIKIDKPAEVNFVVCGAEDEKDLEKIRQHFKDNNCETVEFKEPDIGNQMTAIASHPIPYSQKRFASKYPLLRI
jgi:uncharacterized ferredoxin-like protein